MKENITLSEMKNQIKKLKKKKAAEDDIKNEAWLQCTEWIKIKLSREYGKMKLFSKNWRKEVIVSLYKKEDKENIANYHGITLLSTTYNAMITGERSRKQKKKRYYQKHKQDLKETDG